MPAQRTSSFLERVTTLFGREPLLHFFLISVALLLAYHFFGRPEIRISEELIGGLQQDLEKRVGRAATPEEMRRLAAGYLEDEVLYQEALRSGLTKDNRVRSLLIQTIRTSLRPIVSAPSEAELEALRAESPETYRFPERASFEHVSFTASEPIPEGLQERLRAGKAEAGLGGNVQLPNPLPLTYRPQIERLLGEEFATALAKLPLNEWHGPLRSTRGVHFIRVNVYEPERDMPLAEIRPTLVAAWMGRKETALLSQKAAEFRRSYRVVMPPGLLPPP